MKLTESQKILKNINTKVMNEGLSEDDSFWIVEQVEGAMNPVFEAIDQKFGTEMGYDSEFCTRLCEDIEEQLEEWIDYNSDNREDEE